MNNYSMGLSRLGMSRVVAEGVMGKRGQRLLATGWLLEAH